MRLTYPEELIRCMLQPVDPLEGNRMLAQCITMNGEEVRFEVTGVYKI
jgi:hypothetical protein